MRFYLYLFLQLMMFCGGYAQTDSIRVGRLLKDGMNSTQSQTTLYWAMKLIGTPYKAETLEQPGAEALVVNLREFDCTTFVESVCALALASRQPLPNYEAFKTALSSLRYRNGVCQGYVSRLHYFSDWIWNNGAMGMVEEISETVPEAFNGQQTLSIHYMSSHPEAYSQLRQQPKLVEQIKAYENRLSGKQVQYLLKKQIVAGTESSLRKVIKDGDILATVSSKKGLDVNHLGFAYWWEGRLHWINASSLYHKVVLDREPLSQYLKKQKSVLGIRVIRLK